MSKVVAHSVLSAGGRGEHFESRLKVVTRRRRIDAFTTSQDPMEISMTVREGTGDFYVALVAAPKGSTFTLALSVSLNLLSRIHPMASTRFLNAPCVFSVVFSSPSVYTVRAVTNSMLGMATADWKRMILDKALNAC
ncbi:hypothetical protein BT96DRAFT_179657 [Gymnopus androsaceus JB14]|uniref:Uncharacterized protein n=1 Tax=Gymnopus androsaceus JB14 TaxID=1447944 RepID=A0A6A4H965_9AGAR|nr:hypothetical protein BT96DRAFT_179657 [Gymnopus androsaceus JB14]